MVSVGKNTSTNIRSLVIYHREKGKTIRDIGELLNVSRSTVFDICNRYYSEDRIEHKSGAGRKRKITNSDEKFMLREIKENPKQTAVELNKKLKTFSGTTVSDSTVRKKLQSLGFNSRIARRKPCLSEANIIKRRDFALKYRNHPIDFWKKVIFVDESKFNIFHNDGKQQRVWRKPNQELQYKNINLTTKYGGGNIMIWGAMGYYGVGNLKFIESTMDSRMYLNILKENLRSSAEINHCGTEYYLYQDNDPKHKAHIVKLWTLYNCPHVLETPPQSPDLNPIEHLWDHLDKKIRDNHRITNKTSLKSAIEHEWENIDTRFLQNLVESMPRRLQAVLDNNGLHTKY